jgi:stage II sporulation protein D
MYGVNREFYIGGTSEDVSGMLADIVLENGKLIGITVKKNITDTNVRILLYNSTSSSTVHENAVITSDTSFYVQCGDNITEYGAGEQLVFDSSFSGENVVISASGGGQIKILSITKSQGNPEYEGKLTVYGAQGGVVLVNELPIEDYLKRVVPSEMPASYGVEALKVQAVCARSYAYAHLESFAYPDYEAHMDDTINFQVYNNTVEKDVVNQAISETCGKMLYYADQVITAFYYSTSCGAGTDVSLWGSNTANYPYYVSRVISADNRELDLSVEANFRKFITQKNEKDYDYESSYYRWTVEKTSSEIAGNIKSMGYSDIGEISAVVVNKRVAGGGVNSVTIKGTKADVRLESEGQIRKAFDLPSSFFVVDTNSKQKTFTFTGGGYGHGIGMSQNAVRAMAEQGMDYISILNFFYVGISVF